MGQSQFTPMIPGDDALIPYGQDSTIMVRRSVKSEEFIQSVTGVYGEGKLSGCKVEHKTIKTTKYHLHNSSATRQVDAFYIDHSASNENGGYIITTTDKRTKSVTGFSRFELFLPKGVEIEFTVEEEVLYSKNHTGESEIRLLLKSRQVILLILTLTLSIILTIILTLTLNKGGSFGTSRFEAGSESSSHSNKRDTYDPTGRKECLDIE